MCLGAGNGDANVVLDAAGPDTLAFEDVVRLIRRAIGGRTPIVHVSPGLALVLGGLVGAARRDVLLTRDEIAGLMHGLLRSGLPPLGHDTFRDWTAANAAVLGRRYVSELARNYR
jgi:hypothetical protein